MKYIILMLSLVFVLTSCGDSEMDKTLDHKSEVTAKADMDADDAMPDADDMEDDSSDDTEASDDSDEMDDDSNDSDEEKDYDGVYYVVSDGSEVFWIGSKVVGGAHEGTISVRDGRVVIEDNEFESAELTIDMTTINSTDLEGGSKEKLDEHLKAEDFFDVANHPTASIKVTSATRTAEGVYSFASQMTILGVTNDLEFSGTVSDVNGDLKLATAFTIDKDDYGIASGFKGAALKDEIELDIEVRFSR